MTGCSVKTAFYFFVLFLGAEVQAPSAVGQGMDTLYTARYVVTMDSQRHLIENGAVLVRSDRILEVGAAANLQKKYPAAARLDRPNAILMPGLINTHTHAPMSLFRGLADDRRLDDWLQHYIFPAEAKNVTPDFVLWGTRLACLEMMLSGTTTFVDMYYFEDKVAETAREAGLRGVLGETVIGYKDPDSATPSQGLAYAERFMRRYQDDPLIVATVAPHAPYTTDDATLRAARSLANRYRTPLVIHASETKQEVEESRMKYSKSPVGRLDALGVLKGPTIAAHGVWLDDTDIRILAARHTGIVHCPSSNMKLGSGIAPVTKMLRLGLAVGLGTDGPAGSNNDYDLMEEMNLAADLQKVATLDPQALPAEQAVAMATIMGARVAGLDKLTGSLEPGKRADFITLRLDRPHAVPLYNVYSQIVYALKGSDVEDVVVNGRVLVREGRPLTLNEPEILRKANEYGARVAVSLKH